MINRIEHVGIKVRDLEEAVKFYTEVLGLKVNARRELPASNLKIAFIGIGDSELELLEYADRKNEPPVDGVVSHLALAVDDIDSVLARLKENQAELRDKTPREIFGGSKIAFFKGPSGETLELFQK